MGMSRSYTRRRAGDSAGFTLLEVIISIVILAVGMLALAALVSKTSGSTDRSRYMSTASMLATEKLEDLSRLPGIDQAITITTGNSAGSLTADLGPVTVAGETVSYFDEVYLSSSNGAVSMTTTKPDGTGYVTQKQTPDAGTQAGVSTSALPGIAADMLCFERRWIIENNVPGLPASVRRITVLITLVNGSQQPPVTFQMSTVRQ